MRILCVFGFLALFVNTAWAGAAGPVSNKPPSTADCNTSGQFGISSSFYAKQCNDSNCTSGCTNLTGISYTCNGPSATQPTCQQSSYEQALRASNCIPGSNKYRCAKVWKQVGSSQVACTNGYTIKVGCN